MHFQMAKRKIKCDLNDFVIEYLKKSKYEKTQKIFDVSNDTAKCRTAVFKRFLEHLKENDIKKEIKEEDLGFEINFGAYQSIAKVSPRHT